MGHVVQFDNARKTLPANITYMPKIWVYKRTVIGISSFKGAAWLSSVRAVEPCINLHNECNLRLTQKLFSKLCIRSRRQVNMVLTLGRTCVTLVDTKIRNEAIRRNNKIYPSSASHTASRVGEDGIVSNRA